MSDASRARALAEVQNLYARYAHALDEGDVERFLDCFAADAAMWPNSGPFQPDRGRFDRAALAGFVAGTGRNRPRHIILNVHAEVADGDARAKVKALFLLIDLGTGENRALGRYDDIAVQDADGAWRYAEKRVSFLWQSEAYKARADAMPRAG